MVHVWYIRCDSCMVHVWIDPISAHIGPIGPYRPLSAHIGPYRPLSAHISPYRTISAPIGPYRPQSAHIGPYQPISAPIGYIRNHKYYPNSD